MFFFSDATVEGYPTMVWFHGGDFVRGSPNGLNPFQLVLKQKVFLFVFTITEPLLKAFYTTTQ